MGTNPLHGECRCCAGVAQADPEVVSRLEAEVKRLGEQDQKRQVELDDLAKAKDVADK